MPSAPGVPSTVEAPTAKEMVMGTAPSPSTSASAAPSMTVTAAPSAPAAAAPSGTATTATSAKAAAGAAPDDPYVEAVPKRDGGRAKPLRPEDY